MNRYIFLLAFVCFEVISVSNETSAQSPVVINEIFYNSPDELSDLEYVELKNSGKEVADISGWTLTGEIRFTFADRSILKPGEIIVIAKDPKLIMEFYQVNSFGKYKKSLSNSGGKILLLDAFGKVVESVTYGDRAPWPVAADGYSASIERISSDGPAGNPLNWAPSVLSNDYDRLPSGSPGVENSVVARFMPPEIESVEWSPKVLQPGNSLKVSVKFPNFDELTTAELHYRYAGPGIESDETKIELQRAENKFEAEIPAGKNANRLVRFRIVAKSKKGGVLYHPHPNEIRPAFSVLVSGVAEKAAIPIVHLFFIGKTEFDQAEQYRQSQSEPARRDPFGSGFPRGRGDFRRPERGNGSNRDVPNSENRSNRNRGSKVSSVNREGINTIENRSLYNQDQERSGFRDRRGGFGRELPPTPLLPQGRVALVFSDPISRDLTVYDFLNVVRRKSGWKIRFQKDQLLHGMKTINVLYEPDERTVLNEVLSYQLYELAGNKTCQHGFVRLKINGLQAGYHLYFEQPAGNFFSRNKINDDGDLYKLIWMGNAKASPRVPENERSNRRDITGRYEKKSNRHQGHQDLVSLVESFENSKSDDETWRIIEKNFDVDQVINYFAVNSLISHWDGFFNNFFVYYDRDGSGKWTIYPWDQDSTWSQRGGRPEELYALPLFYGAEGATPDGIIKSNPDRTRRFGGFGRGGTFWWRAGGDFSRPMLANPTFYKRYLNRLEELTGDVFTNEKFGSKIDSLKLLEPEIRIRAKLRNTDEDVAVSEFQKTIKALHEHLTERRKFVRSKLTEK